MRNETATSYCIVYDGIATAQ